MTVYFIGAGPGDPDLITVKGQRLIAACPVCLYAGSLVPEAVVAGAPEGARVDIPFQGSATGAIQGEVTGVRVKNLETGEIERYSAHAVVLATGGYGKIYYLSTLAMGCNGSAIWRAHKHGAGLAASPRYDAAAAPKCGRHVR